MSEVASEYDRFKIRVSKAYLFRSRKIYKTVSADCEQENCFIELYKAIPPQGPGVTQLLKAAQESAFNKRFEIQLVPTSRAN